jgi:hypothetical protein
MMEVVECPVHDMAALHTAPHEQLAAAAAAERMADAPGSGQHVSASSCLFDHGSDASSRARRRWILY